MVSVWWRYRKQLQYRKHFLLGRILFDKIYYYTSSSVISLAPQLCTSWPFLTYISFTGVAWIICRVNWIGNVWFYCFHYIQGSWNSLYFGIIVVSFSMCKGCTFLYFTFYPAAVFWNVKWAWQYVVGCTCILHVCGVWYLLGVDGLTWDIVEVGIACPTFLPHVTMLTQMA